MAKTALPSIREGEEVLDADPRDSPDASVVFIGRVSSPWTDRENCPRNIGGAREAGLGAALRLDPTYVRGLAGLSVGRHLMVIYWLDRARRDLILQNPRHTDGPRGTFALRSPNRPNPLAMSCVTITGIDLSSGEISIDAIDCLDGTPIVDIKPWLPSVDTPAGAEISNL